MAALSAKPVQSLAPAPVLIWFKADLRVDDHPGLHAVAAATAALPLFVFDPLRHGHLAATPDTATALARALASLRTRLQQCGSDLVVVSGAWEEVVPAAAAALSAQAVIAAAEIDAAVAGGLAAVAAVLERQGTALQTWRAPLYDGSVPEDFRELQRRLRSSGGGDAAALKPFAPLDPPTTLPPLPAGGAGALASLPGATGFEGGLPSAAELLELTAAVRDSASVWSSVAAATATMPDAVASTSSYSEDDPAAALINRLEAVAEDANMADDRQSAWEAEVAAEVAAGEGPVIDALSAYLLHVEEAGDAALHDSGVGSSSNNSNSSGAGGSGAAAAAERQLRSRVAAAIQRHDAPASPGGCFPALFGRSLALGVVSRRRVAAAAAAQLAALPAEQPAPTLAQPLALLAWLLTSSGGASARAARLAKASAAAAAAAAGDFHEALAAARQGAVVHGGAMVSHWRWPGGGGLLVDYLHAMPVGGADPSRPALLLVHGFGGFCGVWGVLLTTHDTLAAWLPAAACWEQRHSPPLEKK